MPRNVRNFWIEAEVDGRRTTIAAGPVSKTGGITIRLKMRHNGEIFHAMVVSGMAHPSGKLTLTAAPNRYDLPDGVAIDGATVVSNR